MLQNRLKHGFFFYYVSWQRNHSINHGKQNCSITWKKKSIHRGVPILYMSNPNHSVKSSSQFDICAIDASFWSPSHLIFFVVCILLLARSHLNGSNKHNGSTVCSLQNDHIVASIRCFSATVPKSKENICRLYETSRDSQLRNILIRY